MPALLIDMDGVLYQGDTLLPGAREALAWLEAQRIPHLFLTNTTSRPRQALVDKLASMGITIAIDDLLTPPVAAHSWLRANAKGDIALFVPEATRAEFADLAVRSDTHEYSAVVLGDLGEQWDFATYNHIFRLLMHEPRPALLALGMTRYWQTDNGLQLDVGPFIKGLEYAAGCQAIVTGKPAAAFFHAAMALLGATAEETFMIGDDIRGDIEGAQKAGLRGLLVRTGKYRNSDLSLGIHPHAVLDSIADLPAWWEKHA